MINSKLNELSPLFNKKMNQVKDTNKYLKNKFWGRKTNADTWDFMSSSVYHVASSDFWFLYRTSTEATSFIHNHQTCQPKILNRNFSYDKESKIPTSIKKETSKGPPTHLLNRKTWNIERMRLILEEKSNFNSYLPRENDPSYAYKNENTSPKPF